VFDLEGEVVNPGQKRGILFLHGFLGDENEFKHIGRNFERTHSVVYASLSSVSPKGFVMPAKAGIQSRTTGEIRNSREAIAVLLEARLQQRPSIALDASFRWHDKLPRTQWHLVGYSMGGRIALQLACRWPHLIHRLTLISASPGLETARERRARFLADDLLANQMRRTSMRDFLAFWYRQPLFRQFRAHPRFQELFTRRLQHDPHEMADTLLSYSTGTLPPLWERLAHLTIPTEFICGEQDAKFCDIGRRLTKLNPQIQLRVVANVGHVVHWEAPNAVTQGIIHVENRMAIGQGL
jgi:2-succinyl-6-hydroxy-2,4-cyclohexadiene-1-carboxylate synthase